MNVSLHKPLKILFSIAAFATATYILMQRIPYVLLGKAVDSLLSNSNLILSLAVIFILWILNIYIESVKWHSLQNKLLKTPLTNSVKGVLAGIGISLFLPNRSGEFIGKALMLPKRLFPQASALAILNSLTQLFATIFVGSIFLIITLQSGTTIFSKQWIFVLIVIFALFAMALIMFSFRLSGLSPLLKKASKFKTAIETCKLLSLKHNLKLIALSLCRYLVFTTQTIIALKISGLQESYWCLLQIVAISYILMIFLPVITIAEVPVRAGVFIFALQLVMSGRDYIPPSYEASIGIASFFIWFQNIFISGILGILVLTLHKRDSGNE